MINQQIDPMFVKKFNKYKNNIRLITFHRFTSTVHYMNVFNLFYLFNFSEK